MNTQVDSKNLMIKKEDLGTLWHNAWQLQRVKPHNSFADCIDEVVEAHNRLNEHADDDQNDSLAEAKAQLAKAQAELASLKAEGETPAFTNTRERVLKALDSSNAFGDSWMIIRRADDSYQFRRFVDGAVNESYRLVGRAEAAVWASAIIHDFQPPRSLRHRDT